MYLTNKKVLGQNIKVASTKTHSVSEKIKTVAYKKDEVDNNYNELIINCKDGYGIIFRAYDNAAAYRFFTIQKVMVHVLFIL